jgi:hypothetical protein
MDLGKFGSLIETIAPTIATAIGGPVAGMAVKALSTALLGHENGTEDDITTALATATPDQIVAIKTADNNFKVQMKKLDIDLERISADDRDSARKMRIETKDWTPDLLSFVVVVSWVVIQFYIFSHVVDPSMRELVARVLGTLDAALTLVLSFWFGSSNGSRQKDDTLNNLRSK